MRINALFVLILSLTLAACGGKSPSSPTTEPTATPTPSAQTVSVRVFSGWDDMPISGGASIATPAGRVTTSASGEVSVSLRSGDAVDVSAPGHRDYNTVYRGENPWNVYLWNTTVVSGEYIDALVYNEWVPGRRLSRPAAGNVGLAPSAEISADAQAMNVINACAGEMTTATQRASVSVGGAGVQFALLIDPALAGVASGSTGNTFSGNIVSASRIRFVGTVIFSLNVPCHEIGHGLGLGHSVSPDDIMRGDRVITRQTLSASERYILRMMFRRRPGTSAPDNDRDVTAALSTTHSVVEIDCPLSH
ncbi:MAG: hypothetical protein AAB608_01820 [Patescibacteria group bacterium]